MNSQSLDERGSAKEYGSLFRSKPDGPRLQTMGASCCCLEMVMISERRLMQSPRLGMKVGSGGGSWQMGPARDGSRRARKSNSITSIVCEISAWEMTGQSIILI